MTARDEAGWPDEVYDALKQAGIRQAAYVPDAGHARLIEALGADPEVESTVLTTEDAGFIVAGESDVDPAVAVDQLAARGMRRVLLEGGPTLLARALAVGRVDEVCLTFTPLLAGGTATRIANGLPAGLSVRNAHLVECDGTLLGRWYVQRPEA